MYKFLAKHGQMLAFGLGILVVLLFLVVAWSGLSEFNMMDEDAQAASNIFNAGLYGAILIALLCAVAWLGFGVFQSVSNLKGSTQGLIGLAIIVGIFLVSFFVLSKPDSGSLLETVNEFNVSEGNSKLVGAALWTTVLLIGIAAAAFVVSEVRNFFK